MKISKDNLSRTSNPVQQGSTRLENKKERIKFDPTAYSIENMYDNKAYKYAIEGNETQSEEILQKFKKEYATYRVNWTRQPQECIDKKVDNNKLFELGYKPLCLDIETASICDLACPFCYREYIATPDKTMDKCLAEKLINEAGELSIPSIKFNWRGEPLLNPKLPELIDCAKKAGILETIINTNATTLNEKKAKQIIESGLDVMIYSFDGGSKETYEKNRPGRFKKNTFDKVYSNIKTFSETRKKMGRKFPRTRIQMILTKETFPEQDSFYDLFSEYVDEVLVNTYSERGGSLSELNTEQLNTYNEAKKRYGVSGEIPFMRDSAGEMWIAPSRLGCEQPYQRLMITYDGRVGMCCYDWGSKHPVGFVDDSSFAQPDAPYEDIILRVKNDDKGFELLKDVKMPKTYNYPKTEVSTIKELWVGSEINKVRELHQNGRVDDVNICNGCTFKDTFHWVKA